MHQLRVFTRNVIKASKKNKNNSRHDGLSEEIDIENAEYEEELGKQRK